MSLSKTQNFLFFEIANYVKATRRLPHALAHSYHCTIAPCGNTALNLLGLSTQVTAVWSYISDEPYKTYE